jgi:hypothetical protein
MILGWVGTLVFSFKLGFYVEGLDMSHRINSA